MNKVWLSLALLAALAALAALAVACNKEEKEKPAAGSTPAAKTAEPAAKTAEPAAKTEGAGAAAGGALAPCAELLAKVDACYAKVEGYDTPKKAQEIMKESMKDFPADAPEALVKQFNESCRQYYEGVKSGAPQLCPDVTF